MLCKSKIIVRAFEEYVKGHHGFESTISSFWRIMEYVRKMERHLAKLPSSRILMNRAYLGSVKHYRRMV
jgi:hypothetical protein